MLTVLRHPGVCVPGARCGSQLAHSRLTWGAIPRHSPEEVGSGAGLRTMPIQGMPSDALAHWGPAVRGHPEKGGCQGRGDTTSYPICSWEESGSQRPATLKGAGAAATETILALRLHGSPGNQLRVSTMGAQGWDG